MSGLDALCMSHTTRELSFRDLSKPSASWRRQQIKSRYKQCTIYLLGELQKGSRQGRYRDARSWVLCGCEECEGCEGGVRVSEGVCVWRV